MSYRAVHRVPSGRPFLLVSSLPFVNISNFPPINGFNMLLQVPNAAWRSFLVQGLGFTPFQVCTPSSL